MLEKQRNLFEETQLEEQNSLIKWRWFTQATLHRASTCNNPFIWFYYIAVQEFICHGPMSHELD